MKTEKIVELSFLCAIGIVLQILESFLPTSWIIPGFKIGFANITALFVLKMYGIQSMWLVSAMRVFLASLLQGTLFSVSFRLSASGAFLALCAMSIGYKTGWFSILGISVLGAAFHSIGQVLMVTWIYQQFFMQSLLPILVALSIPTGLLIAMLAQQVLTRLKHEED